MPEFLRLCEPEFARIEEVLNRHFQSYVPFITEVSEYALFSGGKRFRPLLTVLVAHLRGRQDAAVYELAVVPEYLHVASLLHDDVVDGGQLRRGKPPAYKVWGNKAAVLVGDFLYARAIDIASRFGDVRITRTIAETVALMSEGEVLQLLQAKDPDLDEGTYMEVVHRKTAALVAAACRIGAFFSGADSKQEQALTTYGLKLGQAFQMVDDLLDYTADGSELGKCIGTDLAEGKVTLPLVVALREADSETRNRLLDILKRQETGGEDLAWVQGLLAATGSLRYTRQRAEALIREAGQELTAFEPSQAKEILYGLARFVVERRK